MAIHALVLKAEEAGAILDGRAWIYAHFSPAARSPWGKVLPGEQVWIGRSGSDWVAASEVEKVLLQDQLDGAAVDAIRREHGRGIGGDEGFWESSRAAGRVAMLVWLRGVRECSQGPAVRVVAGKAWYVLKDSAAPEAGAAVKGAPPRGEPFDVEVTQEQLKHGYVVVGKMVGRFPENCLANEQRPGSKVMLKPDGSGQMVITDLVRDNGVRFRWSQWGPWFEKQGVKAGDRLQFREVEDGIYTVKRVSGGFGKKA